MQQEALFAGCAAHSIAGRTEKVKKFDGVDECNVLGFSRIFPGVSIAKVIAGNSACHFFLLGVDGNAYAFGRNEDGQVRIMVTMIKIIQNGLTFNQLGFGDEVNRYKPAKVPLPEGASPIVGGACGAYSSYLFGADGDLYSCGVNTAGQLGIGRTSADPIRSFTKVNLEDEKCVSVGAGRDFAVCCTSDGNVYAWGSPEYGQLGNGTEGKSLEKAGKWTFAYRSSPGRVEAGFKKVENPLGIVQVACGTNHTLAMDAEGRVFSWGFGGYGRLGQGDAKDRLEPEPIAAFCNIPPPPNPNLPAFAQRTVPKLRAVKITCGATASYAITGEPFFSLYFWGITKKSGEATLRPVIYEDVQGVKIMDVACGSSSTILALEDHTIVTWGPSPTYGELGYGEGNPKSSTKPKEIESLYGCKVRPGCVAAGYAASFVLVDTEDEASRKVVEKAPKLEQEEPTATSSSKKREAAGPSAKAGGDKKKKKN